MILEEKLKEKMAQLNIKKSDVDESFICSSGPGGQNVNKVATCVVLKYIPTGISVKCQIERSQHQNRLMAWEMLLDKIEHQRNIQIVRQKALKEKVRRANRAKPKSLKEEILRKKKIISEKKKQRKRISIHRFSRDE